MPGRRMHAGRLVSLRWTAVVVAVSLGVLMVAVAPSCSSSSLPRAIVVGDSISALGARPISGEIGSAGWRVTIDALSGTTISQQMPALEKAATGPVAAIVVELGTNDAHHLASGDVTAPAVGADVAAALDLFDTQCVVWVNVDADPSRPGGPGGAVVNAALAAEAARRPNLHVADLNAMLASTPSLLTDDQIHLTATGSTALGQLIAREINRCR
jgi:lysophospholipase L1-like esterase